VNDLKKAYRHAPKLESPPGLDRKIMQAAQLRAHQSEGEIRADLQEDKKSRSNRSDSRWWVVANAVSYMCIFGVGLGVLWQSGMFGGNTVEPDYDVVASAPDVSGAAQGASVEETQIASRVQSHDDLSQSATGLAETEVVAESFSADSDAAGNPLSSGIETAPVVSSVESTRIESVVENELAQSDLAESVRITSENVSDSILSSVAELPGVKESEPVISTLAKSAPILDAEGNVDQNRVRERERTDSRHASSLNWVHLQNPDDYTVQLGVAGDDETLASIAAQLDLSTVLIPWNSDTTDWLLLHGNFTDKALAEQAFIELLEALESLPSPSVEIVPQLVTFGEIQHRLK